MKLLAALLLVLVIAPSGHSSVRTSRLTWSVLLNPAIQQPVEQESDFPFDPSAAHYVTNPLVAATCSWDVDDLYSFYAQGKLNAGQSISYAACVIGSPTQSYICLYGNCAWWSYGLSSFQSQVASSARALSVSLCYDGVYARCFTPSPVYDAPNRRYLYSTCTRESYHFDGWQTSYTDPALGVITDSNNGVGVVERVTLTVTNASHGGVSVFAQLGEDATVDGEKSGGCDAGSATSVEDYPYDFLVYSS